MYPKLFGIEYFNMYGLCIGLGVIFCLWFLRFAGKKLNIPSKFINFVEYNAIISIVMGLLSGMLFQSFYNYLDNPEAGFHFSKDNITFMGGLIGGVTIFLLIYFLYGRKKFGAYLIRLLPIAACCILVAHGCGRIGCFCYGCCHGEVFKNATLENHPLFTMNFPRVGWAYPTQLFEAMFLLFTFFVLGYFTVYKKFKYSMNIYLIAYGIFRFLIEFVRGDDRGSFIPGLTPSQFWAIIMIVMGILFMFIMPIIIKKYNIDFDYNPEKIQEKEVVENN